MRTLSILALVVAMPAATLAQGAGLVGGNGLEPRVRVTGHAVGAPSALVVENLVPSPGTATLHIAVSPESGHLDLGPVGLPGAALGIDLTPTSGSVLWLPPFQVPASGTFSLPFVPPTSLLGTTLYVQALNMDATAPVGGVALSDAVAVTFAASAHSVVASTGPSATSQSLLRVFTGGQIQGPVLPPLDGIEIMPVQLSATHGTRPLDTSVALQDDEHPGRPRILLPHGGALYRYRLSTGEEGWFLVRDHGSRYIHFLQAAQGFAPIAAASPFEPLAAVLATNPQPAYGGARLFLLRTDGENVPGTPSPVHPVIFPSSLGTFDLDPTSLTFLDGALLMSNGASLVRLPTDLSSGPAAVSVPPSGGLPPADYDEELAWSADGTTAAFTAGQSDTQRDVYVVQATGATFNVTQSPGEYEDVSYRDMVDGGRLALAPDASRVAYVKSVAGSKELFVQDLTSIIPTAQLTSNSFFENTIDEELGIFMAGAETVSFHAGVTGLNQDVYAAAVPLSGVTTVANLTATSGVLVPPYQVGSTLQARDMARLPGGGMAYVMDTGPGTPVTLALSREDGSSQVVTTSAPLVAAAPVQGAGLLAVQIGTDAVVGVVTDAGSPDQVMVDSGSTVTGLATDPEAGVALEALVQSGNLVVRRILGSGGPATVTGLNATGIDPGLRVTSAGDQVLAVAQGGGGALYLVDGPTASATQLLAVSGSLLLY